MIRRRSADFDVNGLFSAAVVNCSLPQPVAARVRVRGGRHSYGVDFGAAQVPPKAAKKNLINLVINLN